MRRDKTGKQEVNERDKREGKLREKKRKKYEREEDEEIKRMSIKRKANGETKTHMQDGKKGKSEVNEGK